MKNSTKFFVMLLILEKGFQAEYLNSQSARQISTLFNTHYYTVADKNRLEILMVQFKESIHLYDPSLAK